MPSADFDPNDPDNGGANQGYTPAQANAVGSTNAPQFAGTQRQEQQSYVPWQSFMSANQDVSDREAKKLQGQVQGDVDTAQSDLQLDQEKFNNGIDSAEGGKKKPQTQQLERTPGARSNKSTNASSDTGTTSQPQGGTATLSPQSQVTTQPQAQTTGNPWESFLGPTSTATASVPASSIATPQTAAVQSQANSPTIPAATPVAPAAPPPTPAAPTGTPQDLEQSAGQDAWSRLIGETKKATGEANALGSESGVGALLQQQQYAPLQNGDQLAGNALDAGLINGAGHQGFSQLAQNFGGHQLSDAVIKGEQDSQARWRQLQGDLAARQAAANVGPSTQRGGGLTEKQDFRAQGGASPTGLPTDAAGLANWAQGQAQEAVMQSHFPGTIRGINADGSPGDLQWPSGVTPQQARGAFSADLSYSDAKGSKSGVSSMWSDAFGISKDDAQYVQDNMTSSDWNAYKTAAESGPDAVKRWLNAILARKRK